MKINHSLFLLLFSLLILGCKNMNENQPKAGIKKDKFGNINGKEINIYTLTNKNNLEAKIINYGAILVSLKIPDRDGNFRDVVTGFDSLNGYIKDRSFFGATVGRYGNRIAKGKFQLEGNEYQLTINDGENHLHGGRSGFYKAVWNAEPLEVNEDRLEHFINPDGDEGYPGTTMSLSYINDNELEIRYEGQPINLQY
jgi:aldose 1-epimerase